MIRTPLRYVTPGGNQTMIQAGVALPAWQVGTSVSLRMANRNSSVHSTSALHLVRCTTPLPAEQPTYVFDNAGTKVVW